MIVPTPVATRALAVAMLLLAAPAGHAGPPTRGDDVVVRARKLRDWRAVLVVGKGDALRCRIVRSTGDASLDALACAAQKACFETARPRIVAAATASPRARKRLLAGIDRDLEACFATVSYRFAAYPLDVATPAAPGAAGNDPIDPGGPSRPSGRER